MRKLLSPIINIVSLILVGIAYGLAGITAAFDANKQSIGSYYQVVWQNPNAFSVTGFFLIVAGTVAVLITFLPKIRAVSGLLSAGLLTAGGILALMTPSKLGAVTSLYLQPGLIGMSTLLFVAAFFSLVIVALEIGGRKDK